LLRRAACGTLLGMDAELRAELLRRAEEDQTARRARDDWDRVLAVDAANVTWLRDVVARVGWPGRSMVGEKGAHAAWLLAQHADRDPAFQRRCLDLMTDAAGRGEATLAELAYLTDRVLLAEGHQQEYGTQMTGRKEGWMPRRLRDPEQVDTRRAAMSLASLAEYIADMENAYGPAKPMRLQCSGCDEGMDAWPPEDGEPSRATCRACGWTATLTVGPRDA
jgi:hypothetical protein